MCRRRDDPGRLHVWVGGVNNAAAESDVLMALREGGAPQPANILRVAGVDPGIILQFSTPADVTPAVEVLCQKLQQQLQQQQLATMAALRDQGPPDPVALGLPRSPPGPPRRGRWSPPPPPPPICDLLIDSSSIPPYANRSLWVGQVRS